jgi:hypothetical protein
MSERTRVDSTERPKDVESELRNEKIEQGIWKQRHTLATALVIGTAAAQASEIPYLTEFLSIMVAYLAIQMTKDGSSCYDEADTCEDSEESKALTLRRDGASNILMGGCMMTAIAFLGDEPRVFLSEIPVLAGSLISGLSSQGHEGKPLEVARVLNFLGSVAMLVHVVLQHCPDWRFTIVPIGLTLIANAFMIGSKKGLNLAFHATTSLGATIMIGGSALLAHADFTEGKTMATIVACALLCINADFLSHERPLLLKAFRQRRSGISS